MTRSLVPLLIGALFGSACEDAGPAPCVASGCTDRFDQPLSVNARSAAERCPDTFLWWGNPYRMEGCTENLRRLHPPASYLLPYWMGRYYGFIDAAL